MTGAELDRLLHMDNASAMSALEELRREAEAELRDLDREATRLLRRIAAINKALDALSRESP